MVNVKIGNQQKVNIRVGKDKVNVTLGKDFMTILNGTTYSGSYRVVPKREETILETKNKTMKDNVTITEIPSYKVSNDKGGTTFVIGKELLNG